MGIGQTLQDGIVTQLFRSGSPAIKSSHLYLALGLNGSIFPTTTAAQFLEPGINVNYNRLQIDPDDGNWSKTYNGAAGTTIITNTNQIVFGPAQNGNWNYITCWAMFDSPTGGVIQFYDFWDTAQLVSIGQSVTINAAAINITLVS